MLHREHGAMFARFGTVSDFTAGTLGEDAKIGQTCCPPVTATTDFLAPDILNKCGQGHRRGISAQSPDMGRSYVISDDGVGKIEVHGAQSGDLFPTRKLPPMKETE